MVKDLPKVGPTLYLYIYIFMCVFAYLHMYLFVWHNSGTMACLAHCAFYADRSCLNSKDGKPLEGGTNWPYTCSFSLGKARPPYALVY